MLGCISIARRPQGDGGSLCVHTLAAFTLQTWVLVSELLRENVWFFWACTGHSSELACTQTCTWQRGLYILITAFCGATAAADAAQSCGCRASATSGWIVMWIVPWNSSAPRFQDVKGHFQPSLPALLHEPRGPTLSSSKFSTNHIYSHLHY